MVSKMALQDIEDLQDQGINLTPEQIIRLNALGLKLESNSTVADCFTLPRIARLGSLTFREPTLGHGLWIDRMMQSCAQDDYQTFIAVVCFAISRPVENLPDPFDLEESKKRINAFVEMDLSKYTLRQINAAMGYAMNGNDQTAGEQVEGDDLPGSESVYTGILLQTVSLGLGLSVRDICKLTISQTKYLQLQAFLKNGVDITKNSRQKCLGDYYKTLNEFKKKDGK